MGTVNLALNRPATASTYVMPYAASKAVDGSIAPVSRWLCNKLPGWLSVDLGAPYWINRWVVKHMGAAGWQSPDYNMSDFKLQGSNDNANWTDLDAVTGNTASITDHTITTPFYFRYVRVYVTKGLKTNTQLASLMEFEVYQAPPGSSYLSGLSISSGTLTPAFAGTTFSYTAAVGFDVTSITLTPTAQDSRAAIKVNGTPVVSGQASAPINLNVGANTITVQVTGAYGASPITYTITVTRAASPYLKALTITGNVSGAIALGQTFDPKNVFAYTAVADYDDTLATVVLTADDPSATISTSGGAFGSSPATVTVTMSSPNNYNVPVVVKAADGTTTQAYSLTVTRPSSAYLTGMISLSTMPATNITVVRRTTNYAVTVTASSTKIKATLEDSTAGMALSYGVILPTIGPVTNAPMTNNTMAPTTAVSLAAGTTTRFTITVTSASGGGVKKYNVDVTK